MSTKVHPNEASGASEVPTEAASNEAGSSAASRTLSMIERGDVDIDEDDLEKLVPVLLEDASDGNLESVRQILDLDEKTQNFSISLQVDDEGRTALHRASLEGRYGVIKLLVERNEDNQLNGHRFIDLPDKYGNTALFLVCIRLDRSDFAAAKFLLDRGADINIVKKSDKMSVLHWACHHGNPDLVGMLLGHLCENFVNTKESKKFKKLPFMYDKDVRLPIDIAGIQYSQKWIEEDDHMRGDSLLEDSHTRSTIAEYARVVSLLSDPTRISSLKPPKSYWNRVLFWSATTGDAEGVDVALKNGANPTWKHPRVSSRTALHMASHYASSLRIVGSLLDALQAKSKSNRVNVSKILDADNNNPLHLFVLGNTNRSQHIDMSERVEMLSAILGADAVQQRIECESRRNRAGFRPVDYITGMEKNTPTVRALKTSASPYYRQYLENEPAIAFEWILVFPKGSEIGGLDTQYDKICKQLRKNKLLADMMPSPVKPDKEILVMVGCTSDNLRYAAEETGYEVQLLSSREYRAYEIEDDSLFAPFHSQERMEIIMKKMQEKIFDVDAYLEAGVILRAFPLHDPAERKVVASLWLPKLGCCCKEKRWLAPFSFCRDLRSEGPKLSFQHLTSLKMYVGEKNAFYFAWFSHYVVYLVGAALPGTIVLIAQIVQCAQDPKGISHGECLKTPLIPFFCVWMAVWTTIQHEMWKRKQSELAYRWDVTDAEDEEDVRPEFRGDECINAESGKIEKYYPESARRRKKWFSPWVVLTFVTAAIIAFIGARLYKELTKSGEYGDPVMQGLVATTANSVAVVILDLIYKRIATKITDWENYRLESEYETALVSKTFWFMLVNNTAPLFWAAFYDQDLFGLFKATAITLVSKNVTNVLKDVCVPLLKFKKNMKTVTKALNHPDKVLDQKLFGDAKEVVAHLNPEQLSYIDEKDVRQARMEVVENVVMDGHGGVVGEYAELVIQFSFTTLFACAFPGAPLIVLLINVVGLRGEMFVNLFATQRPETKSAPGIVKAWSGILEVMGYFAILVNLAILVVTFHMELGNVDLVSKNVTHGPSEVLVQPDNQLVNATWTEVVVYNTSRDWWWFLTRHVRINELWAIVVLEHILIILKMCIGAFIEDTPAWVDDAMKRERWEAERLQQIAEEKLDMLKKSSQNLKSSDLNGLSPGTLSSVGNFTPAPPEEPPPRPANHHGFVPEKEASKVAAKDGSIREPDTAA